jgi:hypothetical protein
MTLAKRLSKSDFLDFRACSKSFWLRHHKPRAVVWPTPGAFDRMLMRDGYAVEAQVKLLTQSWSDPEQLSFQKVFETEQCYARADLVREYADGSIDIFEIKGSTSLKSSTGADHIDDAGFQVAVAKMLGIEVRSASIVHVNGDYVRTGDIDQAALFVVVDVTAQVAEREAELATEIAAALDLLAQPAIDEQGCSCRRIGSLDRHCASFSYFNPDIEFPSAHYLPRISAKALTVLDDEGRLGIQELSEADVTKAQLPILRALQSGKPRIEVDKIAEFLGKLVWPLYFYDYETFASAIPLADGHQPQQQLPVQFSLHRLDEDGALSHVEFLADRPGQESELIEALIAAADNTGSAVVWNETFEKSCNKRLARLFPDRAEYLEQLNERTVDLMVPFKADYVHPHFEGSTSIKKILPVLCPALQYPKESVHDGAGAMEAWAEMASTEDATKREQLRKELLAYCHLDSLAMVEILKVLQKAAAH